jgi:hypothetical protein
MRSVILLISIASSARKHFALFHFERTGSGIPTALLSCRRPSAKESLQITNAAHKGV